jgi:hypothetical protein
MNKSQFCFSLLFLLIFLTHLGFVAEANSFLNGASSLLTATDQALDKVGAQRTLKPDWVKVKAGFQSRYRLEYRNNFNLNDGTYEDDWLNLFRNRLSLDLTFQADAEGPSLRFFAEGQEAHSFANSSLNKTNAFSNWLDLRQLFVEIKGPHKFLPLTVKVGRQELAYGDERFVGAFNWSNVSRVFDAAKLVYSPRDWFQLDLFFSQVVLVEKTKPDSAAHHDNFYGIYSTLKPLTDHVFDTFLFIRHNRDNGIAGERPGRRGQLKEYTMGNRFKGKKWSFDYGTEYAVQFGSRTHEDIIAWAFHQEAGYTFSKFPWTPRLYGEYNHASGDRNPADGRFETFDNLFPTNHDKYGYIDFLSLKNMNDVRIGASLKPHKKLTLSADYHWFFLDARESPWFNAAGGVFRAANPKASETLGQELDLLGVCKLTEHLSLVLGYSHFFSGPFVEDTGKHDDADFFYTQVELKV